MICLRAFRSIQCFRPVKFLAAAMSSNSSMYQYETLEVTSEQEHVLHVRLNRPDRLNAMNRIFWQDIYFINSFNLCIVKIKKG